MFIKIFVLISQSTRCSLSLITPLETCSKDKIFVPESVLYPCIHTHTHYTIFNNINSPSNFCGFQIAEVAYAYSRYKIEDGTVL